MCDTSVCIFMFMCFGSMNIMNIIIKLSRVLISDTLCRFIYQKSESVLREWKSDQYVSKSSVTLPFVSDVSWAKAFSFSWVCCDLCCRFSGQTNFLHQVQLRWATLCKVVQLLWQCWPLKGRSFIQQHWSAKIADFSSV